MHSAAASAAAKKTARERMLRDVNNEYKAIVQELQTVVANTQPNTIEHTEAKIALDHLSDYDHSEKQMLNVSGRYVFDASNTEAGPLLYKLYTMIGYLPPALRKEVFTCCMCKEAVPMGERMTHSSRCSRVSRTMRHDGVRNLVLAKARYGIGMEEVRGEEGFHFAAAPDGTAVPLDLNGQRSDLSFRTKTSNGDVEKIRVDFAVTFGDRVDRLKTEQRKRDKYERIAEYTKEPFVCIPAVMNTRGTMQRECETLIRFVSERYQTACTGAYSPGAVREFLGQVQSRMLQREYSMLMLIVGAESRHPDSVFNDATIASGNTKNLPVSAEGKVSRREEDKALVVEEAAIRDLLEAADEEVVVDGGATTTAEDAVEAGEETVE
jgi:hypothetical protein